MASEPGPYVPTTDPPRDPRTQPAQPAGEPAPVAVAEPPAAPAPAPSDEPPTAIVADQTATQAEPAAASAVPAPAADPAISGPAAEPDEAARVASVPVSGAAADRDLMVALRDVSRRFDDRVVLSGINLSVPRGTILGIIGPSGAGKTTTIRMITGAIPPTSGEVSVLGRSPKAFRRSEREQIGYMPQAFTLYEDLTAGENIDFVASLFGMLWRRRRQRVREVLKVVDLWDARGREAGKLSGGMQRRLELACALVHEPELIILDEPTAGIDPLLRGTIWEELHRLRDAGRTLLVTTQHVSEADECDAVAMIVGGRIIALAPPDELRRLATDGDLLDIETEALFDASRLTGAPGVRAITQDGPRHMRITVDDAGTSLPVVVDSIKDAGGEVVSAREYRLSFDEIFAILVARSEEEQAARAAADDGADTGDQNDSGPSANGRQEAVR